LMSASATMLVVVRFAWSAMLGFILPTTVTQAMVLLSGIAAIALGGGHTCALTSSGAVNRWEFCQTGQVGDGNTIALWTPAAIASMRWPWSTQLYAGRPMGVQSGPAL
jgi:hypothetical protein